MAHPAAVDPGVIAFFDRTKRDALPRMLKSLLTGGPEQPGRSVIVHVEGTRALSCRTPVTTMSSTVIDAAIATETPIVPVRFTGGLPVVPAADRLEFPVGLGRQRYLLGKPLPADELRRLLYRERRDAVVAAINGLGPANAEEVPSAPAPAFGAAARDWSEATEASPEHAVLLQALLGGKRLSEEGAAIRDLATGRAGVATERAGGAAERVRRVAWRGPPGRRFRW